MIDQGRIFLSDQSRPMNKKIIPAISCFLFTGFFSLAQVRINEVSPSVLANKKQWIELFVGSGNITEYRVLVKYKTTSTDSGFYVFNLSGSPNASGYFVMGNNNGNADWQSTSLSKKISWDGRELPFSVAESNTVLSETGTNHIFIINRNKIVDALVTGLSSVTTPISSLQLNLNSWTNFIVPNGVGLDGLAVDFRFLQLTNLNTINQPSGSGTFSFIYNNQCPTSSPWLLTPVDTRDRLNTGSLLPGLNYWETDYKISSTINRAPGDFYTIPNNTIPGGSPTFDYANAIPTKLYFKYSLNNTTLSVNTSNPAFKLFYDKGASVDFPNKLLDPTDPEISLNVSSSLEVPNTVYATVPVTADMIYTDINGSNKLRPLFPILVSSDACFKTQSIVLASPLELLPIKLLEFSVFGMKDGAHLNWSTAMEENASGFEIERSIGSPEKFTRLAFIPTKAENGMSQSVLQYAYQDNNVIPGKINYYRLKLIDIDGRSSYAEVKSINPVTIAGETAIFPNPSSGSISIKMKSSSKYAVYVFDYAGREIQRLDCMDDPIDRVDGLKPGFYTIKFIEIKSGIQSIKRLIVN